MLAVLHFLWTSAKKVSTKHQCSLAPISPSLYLHLYVRFCFLCSHLIDFRPQRKKFPFWMDLACICCLCIHTHLYIYIYIFIPQASHFKLSIWVFPTLLLLLQVPRDEEGEPLYEDFICQVCSVHCSFLTLYPQTIWAAVKQPDAANISKEVDLVENVPPPSESHAKLENDSSSDSPQENSSIPAANSESAMLLGENSNVNMRLKQCIQGAGPSTTTCVLGADLVAAPPLLEKSKPMFLSKNWRDVLCKCEKCVEFCTQKRISFLLDKEDSIVEYEKMGKQKRDEKLQQQEGVEQSFLNKLGHVEKMEILSGIADMKNEIHSFLVILVFDFLPKNLYMINIISAKVSLYIYVLDRSPLTRRNQSQQMTSTMFLRILRKSGGAWTKLFLGCFTSCFLNILQVWMLLTVV